MLFAAPVFRGSRLAVWIRWLMVASRVLSLGGLSGVAFGDMQLRNIGIVGYVPVFLLVGVLLGVLFYRGAPRDTAGAAQVRLRSAPAEESDSSDSTDQQRARTTGAESSSYRSSATRVRISTASERAGTRP
jgi:hypothetical protein